MFTLRIWDLPTRLFHWALVLCLVGLLVTGHLGGNAMVWHFRLGYLVLTLLLFRFFWGFLGGFWSRWSQLAWRPRQALIYLKGSTHDFAGHNPLGSLSIIFMLFFLFFQVATGLISDDEIFNAGPLTALVSGHWVSWVTRWHTQWGKLIILALIAVHILALGWHAYRKSPALVPAMFHGFKTLLFEVRESQDDPYRRLLALVLFVCAGLAVYALLSFAD